MQSKVQIFGQIGSDVDTQGNILSRGVELVDVITQVAAITKDNASKDITVEINSPGGLVETGDQITEYLESLKTKGYTLTTVQTGLIGSIATKPFLAGDKRILNSAFKTYIHNPWREVGAVDAVQAQKVTDALKARKTALLDYYSQRTGADKAALEPLMDNETALTADQALALGFATEVINSQPTEKVFASIKTNMAEKKTLLDEIKALFAPTSVPKAQVDLKTADGKTLQTDAADDAGLKGSSVTMDGNAAPDGQYKLADGRSVTVVGGKITEVTANTTDPMLSRIEANENGIKDLTTAVKELANIVKENTKSVITQDKLDAAIKGIKAEIKGTHSPAPKIDSNNNPDPGKKDMSAIAQFYKDKNTKKS